MADLGVAFFLRARVGRGVAQSGQSAAFGTQRSEVQILSPRPFLYVTVSLLQTATPFEGHR